MLAVSLVPMQLEGEGHQLPYVVFAPKYFLSKNFSGD
jgi:hypothetical protein